MSKSLVRIPLERIEGIILLIRGEKVILDADLAMLYGVTTKRLNEQVKRNRNRFPVDFIFQLTKPEKLELVANCDHLEKLKFSTTLPYAFTEHGVVMAANILNSQHAIHASVQVVRAFIQLRQVLTSSAEFARKLEKLETKYDHQFKIVFDAIRQLMIPPPPKSKPIGFRPKALKK
jgi:hypothetical protein